MAEVVISDPELLEKVRRFDPGGLARLYDECSPGLYRYALRRLGDPELAEECVAETFSRFLSALRDGRGPRDYLAAYLYRMAHNWIVDHFRRGGPLTLELDEKAWDGQAGPEQTAEIRLRRQGLRRALLSLTPDQQQVIALKYIEGWENEAIAHSLGKPVGAVKSLQHRALAALKRLLPGEDVL